MTILAFWTIFSDEVDRHTLEGMFDLEAFDILWHKRDELEARFYSMDSDPFGQYRIWNASDFVSDYNNEELDGGKWTTILILDEDYVKQIINE